ncbi:CXXC-20-CXXC protein [Neobacillus drentensis]|nr:CXXC-20-CXXC protein [Neobacillus drentensis]
MKKCEDCNEQFSWNKIFKSFWWTYKPIECDKCGTTHNITSLGRFIFAAFTILPALIFANYLSPFSNILVNAGLGILILIIGSLLFPFFVKFKKTL